MTSPSAGPAGMPSAIVNTFKLMSAGQLNLFVVLLLLSVMVAVVFFIVWVERAHRRIPVQYAKRVIGRRVYGGSGTYIPLKINGANVVPIIFASAILFFPLQLSQLVPNPPAWLTQSAQALASGPVNWTLEFILIVFFSVASEHFLTWSRKRRPTRSVLLSSAGRMQGSPLCSIVLEG